MGYSRSVYDSASQKLYEKQLEAKNRADIRRAEVFSKLPRARELEQEIASCGVEAAKTVLYGGDVVDEMTKLKEKNLSLQKELRELLIRNGYDEDVLEPHYTCEKCGDTGRYEDHGKTLMCTCFKQMLVKCACDELNRTAPLSLSTFESFSTEKYSDAKDPATGIVPRVHMEKILKYCKAYAQSFTTSSESILMKGATGLGKTHLSLAIANEVIKRGYGVIYVSAPALLSKLEKEYFSRSASDDDTAEMLSSCDLLIIDDLGTEFRTQFSVSQIYNIFNSRVLQGKPVIINTNLTMAELEKAYSNRFVSRINGAAQKLDFLGEDLRIRRK